MSDIKKKRYRLGVYEEISGYIEIEAESEKEAYELGDEIIQDGLDEIFYLQRPPNVLSSKHTHGDREVLSCEEIK
tara:strand:+ start:202 stop:426 length:225 start_codon:yes stop_codon:yes gene_type:complete